MRMNKVKKQVAIPLVPATTTTLALFSVTIIGLTAAIQVRQESQAAVKSPHSNALPQYRAIHVLSPGKTSAVM